MFAIQILPIKIHIVHCRFQFVNQLEFVFKLYYYTHTTQLPINLFLYISLKIAEKARNMYSVQHMFIHYLLTYFLHILVITY